jgi:hypothetical protein
MDILDRVERHIGTFFSKQWALDNILHLDDEEQKLIQSQIEKEKRSGEIEEIQGGNEEDGPADSPSKPEYSFPNVSEPSKE